jgi:hypothetical protein
MKYMAMGVLVGLGLATWFAGPVTSTRAEHPAYRAGRPVQDRGLIALSSTLADNKEQLTLIDTNSRVVSVYHIDPATGQIALKSVRNVNWDLQMTQFNGASPLPNEIRTLLQQR